MRSWQEFLALDRSQFFWTTRHRGAYACGNDRTFFLQGADPEEASYDTGNNHVITLTGVNGALQHITFFKDSYYADNIPGVWVHKGRILAGPYCFGLRMDGLDVDLSRSENLIRTDLVECVIPMTTYTLGGLTATAVAFAPISRDGLRPRGAFYTLAVENTSATRKTGEVILPTNGPFNSVMERGDNAQVDIRLAPSLTRTKTVPLDLAPGETAHVPVYLSVYGEAVAQEIRFGALYWLDETLAYYRALCGDLSFPDEPFLAEFMRRTLHQCQQCVGMAPDGALAGSSWGTNPTTYQIWMKDMYYSMLPLAQADPDLFARGVEWFARYGVRPAGVQFPGGVTHSLSNSLSSILMASQYYAATGDADFFLTRRPMVDGMRAVIEAMLASRTQADVWLFPSEWISDGLSMGDFQTGSNITAWVALIGLARILEEVFGDATTAASYRSIAARVREALLTRCVTEGPYGAQLLEGIGMGSEAMQQQMKADSLEDFKAKNAGFGVQFYAYYNRETDGPYLVHDGEETDTTLSSFYGLLPFDDPVIRNYTRFAMTEANRFYCPVSGGILWEDCTDSTFPGYVTGLSNAVDRDAFPIYFERIRALTDLDGSIWWWPYPHAAKDSSVMKRTPGKCGWASGAMLALLQHDLMGIAYDAAAGLLTLTPTDACGPFAWHNLPLGPERFDVDYDATFVRVKNRSGRTLSLRVQLAGSALSRDGQPLPSEAISYLGKPSRRAEVPLLPGETITIDVQP